MDAHSEPCIRDPARFWNHKGQSEGRVTLRERIPCIVEREASENHPRNFYHLIIEK